MKRIISALITVLLIAAVFAGCGGKTDDKTILIGASPTPHAEILAVVKEILAEKGYTLEIKEYGDYVIPNTALDAGDLDANFFQHKPYLLDFNDQRGTKLAAVVNTHFEPFGLYGGKTKSLDEIPSGAKIAVPNDTTNEARALALLEVLGIIELKDGVGLEATKLDIVENPHNVEIVELPAEQLPRVLQDVDFAIINGNYALSAGLKAEDVLAFEDKEAVGAKTYANVIAVRIGDEEKPKIKALIEAIKDPKVTKFINDTYDGAVVPVD